MGSARTYLDHNATSPLRPDVAAVVTDAFGYGNAASVHAEGRRARGAIDKARERIGAILKAPPGDIVFTSGGTEANNMVLRPGALRTADGRPVRRLILGATEHSSVLDGHGFPAERVSVVRVDAAGRIDRDDLRSRLSASADPALVSIQLANSETGVRQPMAEIVPIVREAGAVIHADAVQALGKVPLDAAALGVDAMSLSAHKAGGPMGIGALVVASDRLGPDGALIRGGGQQRGLRSGTENVPAVLGFAEACAASTADLAKEAARLIGLRDATERMVRRLAPDAVILGAGACRLPNTLSFAVPGLKAETALMAFDIAGIALSSGSACSSGKVGRSHVLAAMSLPEGIVSGALRVSFGWTSRPEDVDRLAEAFASLLQRLYDRRKPRAA